MAFVREPTKHKEMALNFQKKFVINFFSIYFEEDKATKKLEIKFPMKNTSRTPRCVWSQVNATPLEISIIMFRSLKSEELRRKENQPHRIDDRLIIVYLILFFCPRNIYL